MFGHQNNDEEGSQRVINPLPSSDDSPPSGDSQIGTPSEPFNPALPSPSTGVSDLTLSTEPQIDTPPVPADEPTIIPSEKTTVNPVGSDELMDIKQQALGQLSPLVGHLDQTPEEKFKTTMMMIQASDNQDLVKDAYAAAMQITDEKAKAQALLDIVNEINYFTQHHQG